MAKIKSIVCFYVELVFLKKSGEQSEVDQLKKKQKQSDCKG